MKKLPQLLVFLFTAAVMSAMDLLWLSVLARSFYDEALGALKRPSVFWPAATMFYIFYVTAIVGLAVWPARSVKDAAQRGACLGFVCYATYELTNWAVIVGWPAALVPVDLIWGVFLTGFTAALSRLVWQRLS